MRNSTRRGTILAVVSAAILAPGLTEAQSVSQILATYMEENESRLEGIDNVLFIQSTMGMTSEVYMEKVEVDGSAVLEPRMIRAQRMTMPLEAGSGEGTFSDASSYMLQIADRAELAGTKVVDGQETTIIAGNDLSGFDFAPPARGGMQEPMQARSMRLFVDTDDWVIRRMELTTNGATPDSPEATVVADFSDFRNVQGMIQPFRIVTSISGMGSAASSEELEEARRSLEQMEEQFANMTEQQRRMIEELMGDQMQGLMEMLASGFITVEIEVQEVRVNEGLPEA